MNTRALPSTRSRQLLAAVVAFALVSVFVIRTSDAAFTDTASNTGNEFATGAISLAVDNTTPLFGTDGLARADASGLKPGDVIDACIEITYTDTLQDTDLDEVTLTSTVGTDNGLAAYLDVTVDRVDDCTARENPVEAVSGTLDAFGVPAADTGWTPSASGDSQAYLFTVEVLGGMNMNATTDDVTFTWSVSTATP